MQLSLAREEKITNRKIGKELWPHKTLNFISQMSRLKSKLRATHHLLAGHLLSLSIDNTHSWTAVSYVTRLTLNFWICRSDSDLETGWSQPHCRPHKQSRNTVGNQKLSDFEVAHSMLWGSRWIWSYVAKSKQTYKCSFSPKDAITVLVVGYKYIQLGY